MENYREKSPQLKLNQYSNQIHLDENFELEYVEPLLVEERKGILNYLVNALVNEMKVIPMDKIPSDYEGKRNLLRALLNMREPMPLSSNFLQKLDRLLQGELCDKGIENIDQFDTISEMVPGNTFENDHKFVLWQGDITRLKVDAIVNAANNQMLGCFKPLHACIDNAIHSAAGPQLREDCQRIMILQSESERTGDAKITRAYNLPSNYVLHTVGPIVPKGTQLTNRHKTDLASCYLSCLNLASQIESIRSIAFCCISTGVFGFPKKEASDIAVNTVNEWLNRNQNRYDKIIFNVFSGEDHNEYIRVFQQT